MDTSGPDRIPIKQYSDIIIVNNTTQINIARKIEGMTKTNNDTCRRSDENKMTLKIGNNYCGSKCATRSNHYNQLNNRQSIVRSESTRNDLEQITIFNEISRELAKRRIMDYENESGIKNSGHRSSSSNNNNNVCDIHNSQEQYDHIHQQGHQPHRQHHPQDHHLQHFENGVESPLHRVFSGHVQDTHRSDDNHRPNQQLQQQLQQQHRRRQQQQQNHPHCHNHCLLPSHRNNIFSVMTSLRPISVLVLILLALTATPTMASYDVCSDTENNVLLPCHPSIFDAANLANLQLTLDPSDATCGTPATTYQRLGDRANTEYTCDAASSTGNAHPLPNVADSDKLTWWQSISQSPDSTELNINLTISFHKLFRFSGDVILTFNSGRPEKMVLEKSVDNGVSWTPLQFYARNCDDYGDQVDVNAEATKENPAVVICTNRYVELKSQPRPGGRVTFDLNERFEMFLGPTLTDYTTYYQAMDTLMLDFLIFSDIRFRFIRPASDGRGNFDEYYYAIQDMNIMARCFCNLHASSCVNREEGLVCDCKHNTQGVNCEECLPLYNERPWQRGSYVPYNEGKANECMKCECNDHAVSCTFDATYGRGVCDECTHNTRGKHCESCLEGFFPNMTTTVSDPERCLACDCNSLGVNDDNSICAQEAVPPLPIGQCVCKEQVTGRQCDSCVPGFYGLLEEPNLGNCTACECNLDGTDGQSNRCEQSGGQCPCKASVTGRQCDTCKDEFYGFPTGKPQEGCRPCECNEGGSTSLTCDKSTGKCSCKTGIDGDKCDRSASGSYVSAIDSLISEPSSASANCDVTSDEYKDGSPFDGTTFAECNIATEAASVTFEFAGGMIQAALEWPYYPAVRYTNKNSETVTGKITVTYQGDTEIPLSPLSERLGQMLSPGCPMTTPGERQFVLPPGTSTAVVLTDNPIVLDGRCKISVTLTMNPLASLNEKLVHVDSVSLLPTLSSSDGTTVLTLYESTEDKIAVVQSYQTCLQKVSVLTTRNSAMAQAPCDEILFAVVADIYNGASPCSCDGVGSLFPTQCASLGGQCTCKSGVGDRACDRCHEGYFNFTSNGCQECAPLPCPTPPPPPPTTPPPTIASTASSEEDDDRLAPVYIVLIIAAILVFICGIILCIYYRRTTKSRRKHVREGVRIMANLGLGDPNSPVYSNDIHQPHYNWVSQKQGVDNPAFVGIPDLPSDIDDADSSFDSKNPTPTPHKFPQDYIIDSDGKPSLHPKQRQNNNGNQSNVMISDKKKKEREGERGVEEKYKLSPPRVKKSRLEKERKNFENERRELNNPRYVDISELNIESPHDQEIVAFDQNQRASVTDLYTVPYKKNKKEQTKQRSSSVGTDVDNIRNGTAMMNQWRPMEDLRMSDGGPASDSFSEAPTTVVTSPEMTSFKPLPSTHSQKKKKKKNSSSSSPPHPPFPSNAPTAKVNAQPHVQPIQPKPLSPNPLKNGISSPQKPKRQKQPKTNDNNKDDNNNKGVLLHRQSSRFNKIYPPPAMFGMINPIFIPDPDYSVNGDISEPMVYIPKPDYPLYAGYESFDEFNGSLV